MPCLNLSFKLYPVFRAVTKALIGGGGGAYSYIRVLPDEFLLKSTVMTNWFSKEIRRAEREYMNIYPPPPINALVTALPVFVQFDLYYSQAKYCVLCWNSQV